MQSLQRGPGLARAPLPPRHRCLRRVVAPAARSGPPPTVQEAESQLAAVVKALEHVASLVALGVHLQHGVAFVRTSESGWAAQLRRAVRREASQPAVAVAPQPGPQPLPEPTPVSTLLLTLPLLAAFLLNKLHAALTSDKKEQRRVSDQAAARLLRLEALSQQHQQGLDVLGKQSEKLHARMRLVSRDLSVPLKQVQAASAEQASILVSLGQRVQQVEQDARDNERLLAAMQGVSAKQFDLLLKTIKQQEEQAREQIQVIREQHAQKKALQQQRDQAGRLAAQAGRLEEQQGKLAAQQGKLAAQQGKLEKQQGKLEKQQAQAAIQKPPSAAPPAAAPAVPPPPQPPSAGHSPSSAVEGAVVDEWGRKLPALAPHVAAAGEPAGAPPSSTAAAAAQQGLDASDASDAALLTKPGQQEPALDSSVSSKLIRAVSSGAWVPASTAADALPAPSAAAAGGQPPLHANNITTAGSGVGSGTGDKVARPAGLSKAISEILNHDPFFLTEQQMLSALTKRQPLPPLERGGGEEGEGGRGGGGGGGLGPRGGAPGPLGGGVAAAEAAGSEPAAGYSDTDYDIVEQLLQQLRDASMDEEDGGSGGGAAEAAALLRDLDGVMAGGAVASEAAPAPPAEGPAAALPAEGPAGRRVVRHNVEPEEVAGPSVLCPLSSMDEAGGAAPAGRRVVRRRGAHVTIEEEEHGSVMFEGFEEVAGVPAVAATAAAAAEGKEAA